MSEAEIKEIKNLGKKSLEEIKSVMEEIGFPLGEERSAQLIDSVKKRIEEMNSN